MCSIALSLRFRAILLAILTLFFALSLSNFSRNSQQQQQQHVFAIEFAIGFEERRETATEIGDDAENGWRVVAKLDRGTRETALRLPGEPDD